MLWVDIFNLMHLARKQVFVIRRGAVLPQSEAASKTCCLIVEVGTIRDAVAVASDHPHHIQRALLVDLDMLLGRSELECAPWSHAKVR